MEQFMIKALSRAGEIINPGTGLGGEDFYNFSTARPSTYFAIGSALPGASKDGEPMYPHHSPIFQIDESCFLVGVKAWLSILQDWLE
jgi:metal-dependent amidase/aminoacylase/carboxypeptidase family protein